MNRVSKAILIASAGLVAIAVLLLLGINLYVQSPGTQARIQEELSKALKLPLAITNTSLTPWSDLQIHGITVPGGDSVAPFLEAASFSAHYRWLPLFRKRLVIYDMRIENPKIVWVQNKEGKWVLPAVAKNPQLAGDKKAEKPKVRTGKKNNLEVSLDQWSLHNGSVEFLDADRKRVALFTGFNVNSRILSPKEVVGTTVIDCINYADAFFVEKVGAEFRYDSGDLTVSALKAELADGSLTGSFQFKSDKRDAPFLARLQFEKVDAALLSMSAGWLPGQASGTLAGNVELHGNAQQLKRAEGKGRLSLAQGQLKQLEFFQTIGQVLQLEELTNLRLKSAVADFHIADEKAFIDQLVLEALNLRLSAQGLVRWDGKIAFDAQLGMQEGLVKKLPAFIGQNLTEKDSAGLAAIGFKVTGKADNPKTDLAEKLVGKRLGEQFENVVSSLFGTKKKKDDKKEEKRKKKENKSPQIEPGMEADPETKSPVTPARALEPAPLELTPAISSILPAAPVTAVPPVSPAPVPPAPPE